MEKINYRVSFPRSSFPRSSLASQGNGDGKEGREGGMEERKGGKEGGTDGGRDGGRKGAGREEGILSPDLFSKGHPKITNTQG